MSIDAHAQLSALRRSRSAGDLPRQPEPIHTSQAFRLSNSHPDVCDNQPGSSSGPRTAPIYPLEGNPVMIEPGRRSPPIAVPLNYPQTRTLGGPSRQQTPTDDRITTSPVQQPSAQPRRSIYYKVATFLGLGRGATRERRSLVGLLFNFASGFVQVSVQNLSNLDALRALMSSQIVVITVMLALCGTRFMSPTEPPLTEWAACSRPLGPWACVWVVRACLATTLNYWGFLRERESCVCKQIICKERLTMIFGSHRTRLEAAVTPENASNAAGRSESQAAGSPSSTPVPDASRGDNASNPPLPYSVLYAR